VRRPDEWIAAARPLRVGAYVLKAQWLAAPFQKVRGEPGPHTEGLLFTSLFLSALAIENALKALLMTRHSDLVENGKLKVADWGHKLTELAARAGFGLDAQEAAFLRVSAEPCITSFGRYRFPVRKSEPDGVHSLHTGAYRHFESIFRRAAETALTEWCTAAADRVTDAQHHLQGIDTDVPDSMRFG
jgi:hypothetical protein